MGTQHSPGKYTWTTLVLKADGLVEQKRCRTTGGSNNQRTTESFRQRSQCDWQMLRQEHRLCTVSLDRLNPVFAGA